MGTQGMEVIVDHKIIIHLNDLHTHLMVRLYGIYLFKLSILVGYQLKLLFVLYYKYTSYCYTILQFKLLNCSYYKHNLF